MSQDTLDELIGVKGLGTYMYAGFRLYPFSCCSVDGANAHELD